MESTIPVDRIRFIGPIYAKRLKKLNINTVGDLLYHFPFRYDDFSKIVKINELSKDMVATIEGSVWQIKSFRSRHGKMLTIALINDGSGTVQAVWFNQPYIAKALKSATSVSISGKVDSFSGKMSFVSPEYEVGKRVHTGRLVPVYPETAGLSSKWLRSRIISLLPQVSDLPEVLPPHILAKYNLIDLPSALKAIHFPEDFDEANKARERFAFEELFVLQLRTILRRNEWKKQEVAFPIHLKQAQMEEFIKKLPFELTAGQKRSVDEILSDLAKDTPMNRLLEGDVGSGKTVVAAIGMYATYLSGFQSAFMAPTEILALQHGQTIKQMLEPFGVKVGIFTGGKKEKGDEYIDVFIGTHALLYDQVTFEHLAYVVIDEQHRFGVEQRAFLKKKGGSPHVLSMTATPIPRTVALTLYGDLDLSVLTELPKGRIIIKTWVVPPEKRDNAYKWIREQKTQTFIVCPLIEESETLKSVRAVTTEYERLAHQVFPDLRVGLLHGRMRSREKEEVINKFRDQRLDILVSTPVVEVGIDIPTATIMMIEGAERFGLAQLHQLRGRVGRGDQQSYCFLFTDSAEESAVSRLKAMERMGNGLEIAEFDLRIRGPGDIYGTTQHGFIDLKVASFSDVDLIEKTRTEAKGFLDLDTKLLESEELRKRIESIKEIAVEPN